MTTSGPRPPVSSLTWATTSTSRPLMTSSGLTASADMASRSARTSTRKNRSAPLGPVDPAKPGGRAADRAGAEHDDGVAVPDVDELLCVDRAGERLGHRGLVEPDALGDPVEPVDLQHLPGHDQVLGEAAFVLVADRGLVRADRHPS